MQLSYVQNSTYFLKMDSSLDGNMYMVLYKKISEDIGEQLFKVKITEHCYKRGSQIYHDLEERIKNNTYFQYITIILKKYTLKHYQR